MSHEEVGHDGVGDGVIQFERSRSVLDLDSEDLACAQDRSDPKGGADAEE